MKKISKFICLLAFAFFAIFGAGTLQTKTQNSANAAGIVTLSFYLKGGTYNGSANDFTLQTDENGMLQNYPIPTHSDYMFIGWYKLSSTEQIDFSTQVFDSNTELEAHWASKSNSYIISQYEESDETYLNVLGLTTTDGLSYTVLETSTSLSEAMELIEADKQLGLNNVTIEFQNVVMSQNETINLFDDSNMTLTGSITSTADKPIFTISPTKAGLTYKFTELELTNNHNNVLVDAVSTEHSTLITIESCSFNSTLAESHAISVGSENYNIALSEVAVDEQELALVNSHTTEYLFNYIPNLSINLDKKLNNAESGSIKISVPYNVDDIFVTTSPYLYNLAIINFVSTENYYNIESETRFDSSLNAYRLQVYSLVNYTFNRNGGSYVTNYNVPVYNYSSSELIPFPTAENIQKSHAIFDGWFGVLTITEDAKNSLNLSSTTYYYDTASLEIFQTLNYDLSKLDEVFATSLSSLNSSNAFAGYKYSESSDEVEYLTFDMAKQLGVAPQFIAKWSDVQYTISFETNGGTSVGQISDSYGVTVTPPANPTKVGHTFSGWYSDVNLMIPYTSWTMTDSNLTLYASWTINSYTVTFVSDGNEVSTFTGEFGTTLEFPTNLSKKGHSIDCWCSDETLTTEFTSETIPGENTTLYAKWKKNYYRIYFDLNPTKSFDISLTINPIYKEYGASVTAPENPVVDGYEFDGWYTTKDFQYVFQFNTMPDYDSMAFAKWIVKQFSITYITNTTPATITNTFDYGETITFPNQPTKTGYIFDGWFEDEECLNAYSFGTMPATNLTLYAKWTPKAILSIDTTPQTVTEDAVYSFKVNGSVNGFSVSYLVNGEWVTTIPKEVGAYDVRIYRAEDANYAEFLEIIEDGFVIIQKTLNITWLIIVLYIFFLAEVITLLIIKKMQKTKAAAITTFSIALPFGIITTSQFVLAIVGAVLVLFMFIFIIYELVKLHRTIPFEKVEPSIYNTRNTIEKMGDKSEDESIANKVDALIKTEGLEFFTPPKEDDENQNKTDE